MKKHTSLILVLLLSLNAALIGCAGKSAIKISLTPEQKFSAAKIATGVAADGLGFRIANLEEKPTENADKIKILKAAKGFLDEFNSQVEDVTTLDLSSKEKVRKAIDKALAAADNLTTRDVLEINDPAIQAEIIAVIGIARRAVKSFDVLFPAPAPAQQ
jgi:hypothetical protein